jgi:hypothetical protein
VGPTELQSNLTAERNLQFPQKKRGAQIRAANCNDLQGRPRNQFQLPSHPTPPPTYLKKANTPRAHRESCAARRGAGTELGPSRLGGGEITSFPRKKKEKKKNTSTDPGLPPRRRRRPPPPPRFAETPKPRLEARAPEAPIHAAPGFPAALPLCLLQERTGPSPRKD